MSYIVIPQSVKDIGASAFEDCSNIKSMYYMGNAPLCDESSYLGIAEGAISYVPKESKGWDGDDESSALPAKWPVGFSSRPIQHWICEGEDPVPVVGSRICVPASWIMKYPAYVMSAGGDLCSALLLETGKIDSEGKRLNLWHDYVAGTDPMNPDEKFMITDVRFENGEFRLTWTPDLNEGGRKNVRKYTEYGRKKLVGSEKWIMLEDVLSAEKNAYKFRKVTVDMP